MYFQHKNLAAGKWKELSLAEQLANVGSETSRALNWQNKDEKLYKNAINRALELLDLTISDPRWRQRLKEIVRVREFLGAVIFSDNEFKTSLKDLDKYFFNFALVARVLK
ncbi:MAG: hypothetical protein AAB789_01350 [Patescibacteria group bacterium]